MTVSFLEPLMAADAAASAALKSLLQESWEHQLREFPVFATYAGDHRYSDRLEAVKLVDIERRAAADRAFLARLRGIELARLEGQDRISHEIFERTLVDALGEHEHRAFLIPITNREGFYLNFARLPDELTLLTRADFQNYIARLRAFRGYMADHIALMEMGLREGRTLPRITLTGIEETISPHASGEPQKSLFFKPFVDMPASLTEVDRKQLAEEGRRAIADTVIPAFRDFLAFMTGTYLPGCRETLAASALPNGRAFYEHRVRLFTSLEVTPERVHEIGLAEVARIRGEMAEVITRTGFQGSFAEFLEHLRTEPRFYADTPEQLLREAAFLCKRMDGELPRLFKRLPRTPYGLRPVPDYIAPKTTSAYYNQPAGDGSRAGLYYLNTYNLKARPLYTLEALSLHEAVPGHHLQIALQQEIEGLPPFRRFVESTAFVEGWALYAERLGLEVGFYTDPYANFGRLTYEMWRACRLVVDTGLHALDWSRERAIDYLTANTALSRHECTTEVDRYIAWPGQALGYKMGELKVTELRRRAEARLGARFDLRDFHDVVLRNGPVPLLTLEREVEAWMAGVGVR